MSASQTNPSNHGTKPKPSSTPDRETSLRSSMATPSTHNQRSDAISPSTASSGSSHPSPHPPSKSPAMDFLLEDVIDRNESWIKQLEAVQKERLDIQAEELYMDYLKHVAAAGPSGTLDTHKELLRRYEEGLEQLEQIKQIQQEELEQHIEMEYQQRMWSLGQQDPTWEGWARVVEVQKSLFANIKRDSARSNDDQWNDTSKIREAQWEGEDTIRRNEEWHKTEPQRVLDRKQWAQKTRLTSFHLAARRERDERESQSHEAQERAWQAKNTRLVEEGREGAARVRARASQATLVGNFDIPRHASVQSETSSRSSVAESVFSSGPAATSDTAASSVANDRWASSDAHPKPGAPRTVPIPTPAHDDVRRSVAGTYSGSTTSPSRMRPAGPSTQQQPSSRSGTPPAASSTAAHSKNGELPRPNVWIPPEGVRQPGMASRRGSTQVDGGAALHNPPGKKASMLFGESPGPPPPPTLPDPPLRASQPSRQTPVPQTQLPTSHSQSARATTLSQPPQYAPNAPGIRSQPLPKTQAVPSSSHSESKASASTVTPASSSGNSGGKPTVAARKTPPVDEYKDREKIRAEYKRKEEERIEEERKRREQEANERRAEDARRRGAEKRRQEEQAREAERREAERKTRKASINSLPGISERPALEIWNAYESRWAAMGSTTELRFRSIPWPVMTPISSPDMLLPIHIAAFILHPLHSQGKSRKDRLREALLRWHPDRFEAKWLNKVVEEERASVQEGVGCVVRALNDLLSAEGTFGG